MKRTGNLIVVAVICLLLVWSYFARPFYDAAWIVAGLSVNKAQNRFRQPFLRQDYHGQIDSVTLQAEQIDRYLLALRDQGAHAPAIANLDVSNLEAYSRSAEALRDEFKRNLRYPPPGAEGFDGPVEETLLGEDELATYYRLQIPFLPGVSGNGIYLLPKKHAPGKLPLVIAAHGRGGMPTPNAAGKLDIVSHDSRDLARGALERGFAVWEQSYVFYAAGQPEDIRDRLAIRAQEAGTTLAAIEIAETIHALDALLRRPEIDASRVAMIGVSYGGFYTLFTTALEPRIKVAVAGAYLNNRETILDRSEPVSYGDWRFPSSLGIMRDPAVVALVCPRPLQIQASTQDQLFPIDDVHQIVPGAAAFYERLHVSDRFEFMEYTGWHGFKAEAAWKFLDRHL